MQVIVTTKADACAISEANPSAVVVALLRRSLLRDGESVCLHENYFRYITAILARRSIPITCTELIEHLWGDDADGGPDNAESRIQSTYPTLVRRQIARLGLGIESGYGLGYRIVDLRAESNQQRAA
jgi:DNA-binding response OmpR family regulator